MFCSQCGTKVNDGAKFCFNCGAKIVGTVLDTNKVVEVEKKIPEEFVVYVEGKCIEAYVQGKKMLAETFYKKADFYEVRPEQVKKIVLDCENKVSKIEKYIDGLYEECDEFELYEEEYDEITAFGNSLGFDDEEVDEIVDYYEQTYHVEEKQKLYSECVLAYIDDGKTHFNSSECVEKYQEVVYKVFEKNILYMEKLLEEQYGLSKEFELNQEQKDLIYLEGSKRFPEDAIVGIIFGYDKKNGILKFREEKEKQKVLESMTVFELYGEQVAYTREESVGIKIGKSYRKAFQTINNDFLDFYNNNDRTKEGYWDDVNKKVMFLIDTIYKAMRSTLEEKGVSQEHIFSINYMDIFKYWIPVFEDVDYQYNVICNGAEYAEYYRKIRKATRGKLIGGGFGLEGAFKGIATAGAINMMTGAAHSAVNFVGNIKSEWKKLQAIKDLFGYSLRDEITVVFQKTVQLVYTMELEILRNYGLQNVGVQLFYKDDNAPLTEFEVKAIQNNPFDVMLYESAIKTKGDAQCELDKIAAFTGIDILKIKEAYINEKFAGIELNKTNADNVFDDIQKAKAELGYVQKSKIEVELNRIKKEMDEEEICVYDVELFHDMRGSFGKPKLVNGKKWIYHDNDKLQEMRQKREEFVSAYNSMKTSEIKSMGETLEILERISSEYGIGKSVVKNLNDYILTKIVTSEMYLDRSGYIKVEQIGVFQCFSVNEYLRVCKMRYKIKEKYEYDSVSPYNAYKIYKDIKQIVGDELWGKKLLCQIHNKIDWQYLFGKEITKEAISEMYNDLIEGELIQDIPELLLREGKYDLEVYEGDKVHYSDAKQALDVLRFNKFVEIIIPTIIITDASDYIKKAQFVIDKKPECLKSEQLITALMNKILELQNNHSNGQNANKEKIENVAPMPTSNNIRKESVELKHKNEDWREMFELAVLYEEGDSGKKDIQAAIELYKELSELGYAEAQWRLARCYNCGKGVTKDVKLAVELFTKAAEQGNVASMNELAYIYFSLGKKEWKVDDKKSLYWWTEAATRMNVAAQYNLNIYYSTIEKDLKKRLYWLEEAAKNGHAMAQNKLAELYFEGKDIEKDFKKTAYWFTQSAKNGYAHGQYGLGVCYANGVGVEKSKDEAKYWFGEASKQGHEEAKKELKRLEGGCYITTAVCESFGKPDDCYELQRFRKFRDEWLMLQPDGKALIDEYYCTAPEIVEKVKNKDEVNLIYKEIWEKYLQVCLEYIESEQYEKCKELYTEMVYTMKKQYCEVLI